jgi:hypothetical protein
MNRQADELGAAHTPELQAAIEQALTDYFGATRRVRKLTRRPSNYRSSFPLEELEVLLDEGAELPLIFKNLALQSLPETVRRSKPEFVWSPFREIEVYRTILAGQCLGTATYYGAVVNRAADRYWLFLEKVPGRELSKVGEMAAWQHAARWLAALHSRFAGQTESLACESHLLRCDRRFFRRWMRRAQIIQRVAKPAASRTDWHEHFAKPYEQVVDRLTALPVTLIHGEFYPSNVLVQGMGDRVRVCPVDWEMAAIGTGLIDLAALTAGKWSDEERAALALAYYDELARNSRSVMPLSELMEALDYCRLHLAVQWLGWSADWTPPPEHRQDWLAEARRLIAKLGLK